MDFSKNHNRHYLLYPNLWLKKQQIKRRFHGHAVFYELVQLGRFFELRSNWHIYLEEFAFAFATGTTAQVQRFTARAPYLTHFEKKYSESGHMLYRLQIQKPN